MPLEGVIVTHFVKWPKLQELGPKIIEVHLPPLDDEDDGAPPIPKITIIKSLIPPAKTLQQIVPSEASSTTPQEHELNEKEKEEF